MALVSVALAFALGLLGFGQLVVVAVVAAAADITFTAAIGGRELQPARRPQAPQRARDLLDGWRDIFTERPLPSAGR